MSGGGLLGFGGEEGGKAQGVWGAREGSVGSGRFLHGGLERGAFVVLM